MYNAETNRVEHSSYGVLRFSRYQGKSRFFDVEPELDHGIALEISEAYMQREFSRSYIFPKKTLLKARMSSHQFAEAITSLNVGSGVPITLEYVKDSIIEPYVLPKSHRQLCDSEIKKDLADVIELTNQLKQTLKDLKAQSKVNKKDLDSVENTLNHLHTKLESDLPYIESAFEEVLDSQTLKAKVELLNWIETTAIQKGLNVLSTENLLLGE